MLLYPQIRALLSLHQEASCSSWEITQKLVTGKCAESGDSGALRPK